MAGVITTGNHPKALWPGINAIFGIDYAEKEQQWSKVFKTYTSDKQYEEDFEATSFGLMPIKPQGSSIQYDSHSQGPTTRYTNVTYGLGWIVTREEKEDNQYPKLSQSRTRSLAYSARQTKETVHGNILNRAFTAAFAGGDGVELCATTHPTFAGNQSNLLSPTADLSEASLEDMFIQIRNMLNARGLKINPTPQMLIVGPSNQFEAYRIVNSTLRPGSANHDINAIRDMGMLPKGVLVYDYLTVGSDDFFVTTDVPNGLKHFARRGYEFVTDSDFDTENMKAKCTERYVAGWSDWRAIVGSSGV